MAIAPTTGLVLLPFGERPQYGSPYPEGMAVAHINATGDATGGDALFLINADPGLIFRLELAQLVRGTGTIVVAHALTSHRWATDKSGLGTSSFDLNWNLNAIAIGTFSLYVMSAGGASGPLDMVQLIKRFPMGSLQNSRTAQSLMVFTLVAGNVDTITHELSVVCTYWRKESLYQPGFLASYHESPAVPPLFRSPI